MNAEFENQPGGSSQAGESSHTVVPARRNKLVWILPIGCLGVMACCFAGIGIFGYLGYQQAYHNQAYVSAVDTIQQSTVVHRLVGSPVTIQRNPDVQAEPQPDVIRITYLDSFSGPRGTGAAKIVVAIDRATGESSIESIQLTIDGQIINLSGEGDSSPNIDDSGNSDE